MSNFGDRLKSLRIHKKYTQEECAKFINVHKGTISNWENGYRFPDEDILFKLADLFDVSLDYLLGRSDILKPYDVVEKSEIIKETESLYKIDPDMLIQMCRATDLPAEERQKIKEYSALLIEKFLRERAEKEKDNDK